MAVKKYKFNGLTPANKILWLDPAEYRIRIGSKKTEISGGSADKGIYVTDIAEIRQGPRTMTFGNFGKAPSKHRACLSIIGSERTIDVELPTEVYGILV